MNLHDVDNDADGPVVNRHVIAVPYNDFRRNVVRCSDGSGRFFGPALEEPGDAKVRDFELRTFFVRHV